MSIDQEHNQKVFKNFLNKCAMIATPEKKGKKNKEYLRTNKIICEKVKMLKARRNL